MRYQVAGLAVDIESLYGKDSVWKQFLWKQDDENPADITIEMAAERESGLYCNIEIYSGFQEGDRLVRRDEDLMLVRGDWSYGLVYPLRYPENMSAFLIQLFYSQAIKKRMIQVHSSLISFEGIGVLFLGPSGIGKTTQAELWKQYQNAVIVNGDMVFVQEREDGFWGWGTPWTGSSPYCENISVPICALVVLKQKSENSIRELTGFEKVSAVSGSIFYPQWTEGGMELCLEVLDHLLENIRVYELSCRPDASAVRITKEKIFGR